MLSNGRGGPAKAPEKTSGARSAENLRSPDGPPPAEGSRQVEASQPAIAAPPSGEAFGRVSVSSLNAAREAMLDLLEPADRKAKMLLSAGRFTDGDESSATYGLPNAMHLRRCEEWRATWEVAVRRFTGAALTLRLGVDTAAAFDSDPPDPGDESGPGADAGRTSGRAKGQASEPELEDHHDIDLSDLVDAPAVPTTLEHLTQAFPGAEVVTEPFGG